MERSVLVAEDDPMDAWLLSRALIKAGIGVRTNFVRDGQEALDYLGGRNGFGDRSTHPFPEVFILDLKMPRLNGFDVLTQLRENPTLRPNCVVVLTSSELSDDRKQAEELGADHFITKPTSSDFSIAVASLLDFWTRHACFRH